MSLKKTSTQDVFESDKRVHLVMDTHKEAVLCIAEKVRNFHDRDEPFRLYHGSTNSTRYSGRYADNVVDTSELKNIFEVDSSKKTVLVEPNVSMEALVDATLPHGLVPLVVMEFLAITVGGGFSGTSGESSSFRYGAFDATINSIEIILADGTVSNPSKYDRQDLFWGAASGFGTLGVVTLLEMQLKDAKPFVELNFGIKKKKHR
ncbi:uncharacterized protein FIESC28_10006 [Fusarium coffeatum]|uniref:Delta(24)-sterol reductase n=1 Tax=Fusarium coffeatum TaxID=231269 RepID=A0A366QYI7_9HYPO|nr:uncharacterized protein FIESC28_10006 [Fusarium coffeatum]RBR09156.1 hypothetical protein FIESC28_10006 [Fusarium coffeatum]